jgi:hypothetical protein
VVSTPDTGESPRKRHEATDRASIRALLDSLNACHDGVVRRISFQKDVAYAAVSARQVVLLRFEDVQSFRFLQEDTFDYSFLYEVVLNESRADGFEFLFRAGWAEKAEALRIVCARVVCVELDP